MKTLKKISILVVGSVCTFYLLDSTIGNRLRHQNVSMEDDTEEELAVSDVPTAKQFNKKIIAMHNPAMNNSAPDFFHNTYSETPDAKGLPQLKPGKHWYNAEKMEEVSQSANIEAINRDDE